jgi:predicted branched-subunit amino acid permease
VGARAALLARPARRQRFRQGLAAVAPALPGVFAWGLVTGIALVKGGLTVPQALGISFLVLSGTTALVAVPLLAAGVSLPFIALTAVLTGLRFPVYSAALSPDLKHLPARWRWLAGFLMTDPGTAVYLDRRGRERPFVNRLAFYAGVTGLVWPVWLAGSVVGIGLGAVLPGAGRLGYLGILAMLALVAPMLRGAPAWAAALAAAAVALLGAGWPWKLGLLAAVLAGLLAALLAEMAAARQSPGTSDRGRA